MELWPQHDGADSIARTAAFKGEGISLANLFDTPASAWSLKTQLGVLLAHNRLAFLDRSKNLPVAALIQMVRSERARAGGGDAKSSGLPTYEELRDYNRELLQLGCGVWTSPSEVISYRGHSMYELDHGLAAMYLWDRLTPTEREDAVNKAIKDGKTHPVPVGFTTLKLSHFSAKERDTIANWERSFGFQNPQSQHPGYVGAISDCNFYVETTPWDKTGTYRIRLTLSPPEGSGYFVVAGQALFSWKPEAKPQ